MRTRGGEGDDEGRRWLVKGYYISQRYRHGRTGDGKLRGQQMPRRGSVVQSERACFILAGQALVGR